MSASEPHPETIKILGNRELDPRIPSVESRSTAIPAIQRSLHMQERRGEKVQLYKLEGNKLNRATPYHHQYSDDFTSCRDTLILQRARAGWPYLKLPC